MDKKVPEHERAPVATRSEKACTGRELAKSLEKSNLSSGEARKWRRDLKNARKILKAPENRWG